MNVFNLGEEPNSGELAARDDEGHADQEPSGNGSIH